MTLVETRGKAAFIGFFAEQRETTAWEGSSLLLWEFGSAERLAPSGALIALRAISPRRRTGGIRAPTMGFTPKCDEPLSRVTSK
ncbi:hypothetical protein [Halomonas sp. H5]|uniref:hypothetical protein n=1 Tax=Halomonas sp. H5 TaxID=3423910 RepID=UPI003D36CFEC